MNKQGIYLYGFAPTHCFDAVRDIMLESGIYSIEYSGISAIVSDTRDEKLEYLDREALAYLLVDHQKKLEKMMSSGCSEVIPVQLGTIVSSGNDVIKILKLGFAVINDVFKIIGTVEEFDLVAVWNDFPDFIRRISDTSAIRLLKEEIAKKDTYEQADSIHIGKLIKKKIDDKNNKVNSDVINSLMPYCFGVKKHETMNDEMPVNSAFLVKKENKNLYMDLIDQLDIKYADQLNFKIVGPLPCYSFYTIECKVLDKDDIEKAKEVLGIEASLTEGSLKRAYRMNAGLTHPDKNSESTQDSTDGFIKINHAYKILLEYLHAIKQSPDMVTVEPLYLVKIKK
ncbi:MAG: GvpL/GvpF family gas vesicle protein [Bacteroidales bacterium]|jgi:Gas vesicle synthesis protein GvpL/GvpF/DnaJ domain